MTRGIDLSPKLGAQTAIQDSQEYAAGYYMGLEGWIADSSQGEEEYDSGLGHSSGAWDGAMFLRGLLQGKSERKLLEVLGAVKEESTDESE